MEEYVYKNLTLQLFRETVEENRTATQGASGCLRLGVVIQAYLKDSAQDIKALGNKKYFKSKNECLWIGIKTEVKMYLSLYRKYRPKSFEDMCGEEYIIKAIKNALKNKRVSHAYLFCGPRGVGKTTTARIIAKGLNCLEKGITDEPCNVCENCKAVDKGNFTDMIEIDAASNRGIDEIRNLKDRINYKPVSGIKKIYIIDEVHMLTKEAFNALLKTLEEPPEHVVFVLATTEPDKVLDTIISRCQRYDFLPVSYEDISSRLKKIAESEKVEIDEKSIRLIYEKSGGSVRDSISIFEK